MKTLSALETAFRVKLSVRSKVFFRFLSTFLPFVMFACATQSEFVKQMNSWEGGDINKLIMQFGPPGKSFQLPNGTMMYSWLWVGNTIVTSNYNQFLNMVTSTGQTMWCEVTFTAAESGQLQGWGAKGNACRAR